jgi:hypothetical protein
MMARLTRRAVRLAARRTAGHPGRRLTTVTLAGAGAASLVLFWMTHGQFRGW